MLLREWLLHGHLQDRVGIPLLYERASNARRRSRSRSTSGWRRRPIYSVRTQELLGFRELDRREVILKNIQLDIGAPPQFMDFRMRVDDDEHGEFWLDHCGALMDVEPMGDEWVRGHVPHHRGPDVRRDRARHEPARGWCGRSTGRRASRPTGTRTATGR